MLPRLARRRRGASPQSRAIASDETPAARQRGLSPQPPPEAGPATELLLARLSADQLAPLHERMEEQDWLKWEQATPDQRKHLTLAYGLRYDLPGVAESTGLTAAAPPATVHSMTRGWVSEIGGSYYFADLVLEALDAIGAPLSDGVHALDFSCSSGRVVRALAAALPDVQWHGCDPNRGAIAWATENLPAIDFFVSSTRPPLPFDDGFLALAFAISVWSHYSADAALRWLDEMHRVVRPGGHVVLTTHGLHACTWFARNPDPLIDARLRTGWIDRTRSRLEQDGHCFWQVFGKQGDWGVVDSDWGLAFFTPEWLLANITPAWSVRSYRIGRAHDNQDVYLLERT
jgi:SAM-dependent methyltransferase